MIKSSDMAKALMSMVEEDGKDADVVSENFIGFIEKYNLRGMIKNILSKMESFAEKKKEDEKARVTFAEKEDEFFTKEVKKIARIKDGVECAIVFDKEILGGFKAKYKNKIYDYSLLSGVNKLRDKLKQA